MVRFSGYCTLDTGMLRGRFVPGPAYPGEEEHASEKDPTCPRQPITPATVETDAVVDRHRGQQYPGDFFICVPLRYGQFGRSTALHWHGPDVEIGIHVRIGAWQLVRL